MMILVVLALSACGNEQPPPAPQGGAPVPVRSSDPVGTIVAVGDSLTAGYGLAESEAWPSLVANQLTAEGRPYRVINAGVSGETSGGTLARVEWIQTLAPDIVILETGANDGLRGLDTRAMAANIDALVAAFQKRGVVVVLVGMKMVRNLGPDYVGQFEAVYPEIANRRRPLFLPFLLEGVAGKPELNLTDGIHPNAKGHQMIADRIYPVVVDAIAAHRQQAEE